MCRGPRIGVLMRIFFVITSTVHAKELKNVWSVLDDEAEIPCPLRPIIEKDEAVLVLWYQENDTVPIYSYDARLEGFRKGVHHPNKELLDSRSYFKVSRKIPVLTLKPVYKTDAKIYTCKVDYSHSPTSKYSSRLNVAVPPQDPVIAWDGRVLPQNSMVGPIREGSTASLSCRAVGGYPSPNVTWYLDDPSLFNKGHLVTVGTSSNAVKSELKLKIDRRFNGQPVQCRVQMPHLGLIQMAGKSARITLNVTLPPVKVKILGDETPVIAKEYLTLKCQTWGSNPPAEISWWKAGEELPNVVKSISGNLTVGQVSLQAKSEDNGVTITCRASNPLLQDPPLTDNRKLIVLYRPENVEIKIQHAQENGIIVEGVRLAMICEAKANPRPSSFHWYLNNVLIKPSLGTIISGWSLVINKVSNQHNGNYSCMAANRLGTSPSQPKTVVVAYVPTCETPWLNRTIGAPKGPKINIDCRVRAQPQNVSFLWVKLGRKGEEEVKQENIMSSGTHSQISYSVHELEDYTDFYCFAKNSVGLQMVPCRTKLIPEGPPDSLLNCSSFWGRKRSGLKVSCLEGFDGGAAQKFVIQIISQYRNENQTSMSFKPIWEIKGLTNGSNTTLKVFSYNKYGTSQAIAVSIPDIVDLSEKSLESTHYGWKYIKIRNSSLIIAGIGLVALILLSSVLSIIVVRIRRKRRRRDTQSLKVQPHNIDEKCGFAWGPVYFHKKNEDLDTKSQDSRRPDILGSSPHSNDSSQSSPSLDVLPLQYPPVPSIFVTSTYPSNAEEDDISLNQITIDHVIR